MGIFNLFTKICFIFITAVCVFYFSVAFSHKNIPALEIIEFHTSKNATTQQVLDASKKLTLDLKKHPGFINRTLTQDPKDPNLWTDIIEWKSVNDGVAAMRSEINSNHMVSFMDLIKKNRKTNKKTNPDMDISYLNIRAQS